MKKRLLLTLLAMGIIPNTLFAYNINTGTIEVSGGANFGFASTETDINGNKTDVDGVELSIDGLYYVAPNLGVGLHWEYESSEEGNQDSSEIIIGPAIAFNISIAPKMSVKPLAYIGLVNGENGNNDYDGMEWGLGTSLNYFIRDNISIDAGVIYKSYDVDYDAGSDVKITGFGTTVALSVYF